MPKRNYVCPSTAGCVKYPYAPLYTSTAHSLVMQMVGLISHLFKFLEIGGSFLSNFLCPNERNIAAIWKKIKC